jgi:hypothetical protein
MLPSPSQQHSFLNTTASSAPYHSTILSPLSQQYPSYRLAGIKSTELAVQPPRKKIYLRNKLKHYEHLEKIKKFE